MEGQKELDLGDMVDVGFDEHVNLITVKVLQDAETSNVEWLG